MMVIKDWGFIFHDMHLLKVQQTSINDECELNNVKLTLKSYQMHMLGKQIAKIWMKYPEGLVCSALWPLTRQ